MPVPAPLGRQKSGLHHCWAIGGEFAVAEVESPKGNFSRRRLGVTCGACKLASSIRNFQLPQTPHIESCWLGLFYLARQNAFISTSSVGFSHDGVCRPGPIQLLRAYVWRQSATGPTAGLPRMSQVIAVGTRACGLKVCLKLLPVYHSFGIVLVR